MPTFITGSILSNFPTDAKVCVGLPRAYTTPSEIGKLEDSAVRKRYGNEKTPRWFPSGAKSSRQTHLPTEKQLLLSKPLTDKVCQHHMAAFCQAREVSMSLRLEQITKATCFIFDCFNDAAG